MMFWNIEIQVLFFYLVAINLIAFFMYGVDKLKAKKGKWRISEKALLGIALMGGGLGAAVGMGVFRHKTKHLQFRLLVPISMVLWVIILWGYFKLF